MMKPGSIGGLCAILAAVERDWAALVGESLARRSCLAGYEDGYLCVRVENQAALTDMNFKKTRIAAAIRSAGKIEVKGVKVELGRIRPRTRGGMAERAQRPPEIQLDEAKIGEYMRQAAELCPDLDEELKKRIARLRVLCETRL